ncbi:MAG: MFS transporter [Pseudomonadota bacterium]
MTALAVRPVRGLLWRYATATTLIVMAFAMTGPVLAVLLQQRGHSTSTVGAFAMVPFLLVGLLIPVMPRVLARWGVVRVYRAGALLQLAGALVYPNTDVLAAWVGAAVLNGAGAAALWNATESLLAREAPPDKRGRVMGLYQTALGAALALGPFMPALLGTGANEVLWAGAAAVAVCCAIAFGVPVRATREPQAQAQSGTWHALRDVPLLAFMAFAGGVFEAGLSSVSAAHAAGLGLSLSAAASVAGAIGVGSFLCQYPAGWASDHFRLGTIFRGAALLLLGASAALAFAGKAPWLLWAVGWIWGGVGGALYTLSIIRVAHVFAGRPTAGGTAAVITGYTMGGMAGPLASGAMLDVGGVPALAALLSALAIAAFAASRGAAMQASAESA